MTKNDTIRFTFRIPKELGDKIKNEAKTKGFTMNCLILSILWEWEKEQQKGVKRWRKQKKVTK